jgi:hypothetical protein
MYSNKFPKKSEHNDGNNHRNMILLEKLRKKRKLILISSEKFHHGNFGNNIVLYAWNFNKYTVLDMRNGMKMMNMKWQTCGIP